MEELKALRLKEKILLIELKAVQQQIALYDESLDATTVESVQVKTDCKIANSVQTTTESIPFQTVKGKEKSNPLTPDALGKSMKKVNDEPQSSSSPVANGSGKDGSNPLMAGSLPKTMNLRPSYAQKLTMQEDHKARFYVIFDGEHRGIYEDWTIVSRYAQNSSVPLKKFGSLLQAQQEATKYSAQNGKKEIPLKVAIFALPKTQKKKNRQPVIFTKTTGKEVKAVEQEDDDLIGLHEFRTLWSKARSTGPEDFEVEQVYTEDTKNKSLFVFCPGADPVLVSSAFSAGLIKYIYPSADLQEIGLFPEGMKKAIKTFKKKIAVSKDANIYIKCSSTLPDWYQGKSFAALHLLEIGLAKRRSVFPSQVMDEKEDISNWVSIRTNGYLKILEALQRIKVGSLKKINYYSNSCIIVSHSGTPLQQQEKDILELVERRIISNEVTAGPATKKLLCCKLTGTIKSHSRDECGQEPREEKGQKTFSSGRQLVEDTREMDPTHGFIE